MNWGKVFMQLCALNITEKYIADSIDTILEE